MKLNAKQRETKELIGEIALLFEIDPDWAAAVAMVESSLGIHQKSPTGCQGIFQMSAIAMKDLLLEMEKSDDELIDIVCGVAFLKLLLKRWGNMDEATRHFCDPRDRSFYLDRVYQYKWDFTNGTIF